VTGPRWCDAAARAAELRRRPADLALLLLLTVVPFVTPRTVARLEGLRGCQAVHARLRRLRERDLVELVRPAFRRWGTPRLPYATDIGLAVASLAEDVDLADLVRRRRLGRAHLHGRLPGVEHLLHAYVLLGALAAGRAGRARLLAWERPWRHTFRPPTGGAAVSVVLPAYAELAWEDGAARAFLLVPDPGTVPIAAYAPTLDRLLRLRHVERGALPPLVVLTRDDARHSAWERLLESSARKWRDAPLAASVATWRGLAAAVAALVASEPGPTRSFGHPVRVRPGGVCQPGRALRSVVGGPLTEPPAGRESESARLGRLALGLTAADRLILDLLARHPFLPTDGLAVALGCTCARARWTRKSLLGRGLVRLLGADEAGVHADLELAECTLDGLRLVAARDGLRLARAVRYRGLGGGGPEHAVGTRRQLLKDLAHTLGADGVFVALVRLAGERAEAGGDDELPRWENARACARGGLCPDGYGVYRAGGRRHPFYVEYDRGTMYERDLRQKLRAYHEELGRARRAGRGQPGFPDVLVVVAHENEAHARRAEERIARVARAVADEYGQELPILITRLELVGGRSADAGGLLGPVWRTPSDGTRRRWLPEAAGVRRPGDRAPMASEA
jgi:hypothetical protein